MSGGIVTGAVSGLGAAATYSIGNNVNILTGKPKPVYHYTNSNVAPIIENTQIKASNDGYTYTTTDPNMSSNQAIDALYLDPSKVREMLFLKLMQLKWQ